MISTYHGEPVISVLNERPQSPQQSPQLQPYSKNVTTRQLQRRPEGDMTEDFGLRHGGPGITLILTGKQ